MYALSVMLLMETWVPTALLTIQLLKEFFAAETGEILPYSPIICIDQEEVDFDAQFDGINVLVTSEIDMSDERILESYKELSKSVFVILKQSSIFESSL